MSCRLNYVNKITEDIKEIIGIDRTSAKLLKPLQVLLPVGGLNNSNESLKTKDNTYNWAKSIQNTINNKYNSKVFGNLIEIDNKSNPLGTIVNILIPTKLIDAYERKYGTNIVYQTVNTVSKKNEDLESDLKEFATINGIKIEFIGSLIEQFNGDYTAAYNAINKTIYINENKAGLDTLAEEVSHSLTLALGSDHTLVRKAFNLLSKTDFKSTLDPEYVKLYKNSEDALKHEALGKLIAQAVVRKYTPTSETEFKLFGAIMQLIDKFISLFRRNDRIEDIVNELANKITNKEVITFTDELPSDINKVFFQVTNKDKSKIEDKEQYLFLKQQLKKFKKLLTGLSVDSERYKVLKDKIDNTKSKLEELEATGNKQLIIDLGSELLDNLELMLNEVEDPDINRILNDKDIANAEITFNKFKSFAPLSERAINLYSRLLPIIESFIANEITKRAGENEDVETERIFGLDEDINRLKAWFGKLSNSKSYISRTVGSMIKEVQTKVSSENKAYTNKIKEEVELLREWSKNNSISESNMYDIFNQKYKNTTILAREFQSEFYEKLSKARNMETNKGKAFRNTFANYNPDTKQFEPKDKSLRNKNYQIIQKTPALKRFYEFHKSIINEAASKLPANIKPEFIPNIVSNNLLDGLALNSDTKGKDLMQLLSNITGIDVKQFEDGTFVPDENLFQDIIPLRFIKSVNSDKKSTNLGDNLNTFIKFANSYEQMSEILPTLRTLQNQLGRQSFTKSSDPGVAIQGTETNIYNFVKTVIDMQVKGETKKDEGKIKTGNLYDDNGKIIGEKYIHTSRIIDFGLKYNSLLRIGLNPINATTNVLVGDIGNIIEGFGSRFYSLSNLKDATNIYFRNVLDEQSDLQKWRDKIGPLQELDDYETVQQESTGKRISREKIEELMYMPQKIGENFLQNRTMIAILIKDGYMDSKGNTTDKGNNITEDQLKRLTNKVYEINNKIHGRYSSRDAAAISQNVLARMILQFKKWIPAAIESRFESKHYNIDLGAEVEGRYRTGWKLMLRALKGDFKALKAGNMTELELYNMRKNLAEIVLALGSTLTFIALGGFGDDDEKLKKNPYFKFTMDQLDRVSGDLLFFVNPGSYADTALKPVALMKTTNDVINVVIAFPYIFGLQGNKDIYQSGVRKKENKFTGKLVDIVPIIAPIAKVARNFKKDVKYTEPQ